MVFNTGPYTVLPDNSILNTANMQSETGFPSSPQLKSYVTSKSRLKLAARAVLSADAGLLVTVGINSKSFPWTADVRRYRSVYVIAADIDVALLIHLRGGAT